METTTSFPYSIVRFCTMNEVQVKTVIWSSRKNIHSVLSQKKEILDICSIACEKFTGGEKTAKWVEVDIYKIRNHDDTFLFWFIQRETTSVGCLHHPKFIEREGWFAIFLWFCISSQYGGSWHVIVGENFSTSITYEKEFILYMNFGGRSNIKELKTKTIFYWRTHGMLCMEMLFFSLISLSFFHL